MTVFRKGFLMALGLKPTQDGAGPRMGIVGEGEEAGEISIIALVGVLGADMSFLRAMVGISRFERVRGAMVGNG